MMARPALSALRTTEVFDLLMASPDRRFTMAEIAREAGINPASCHALLNVLCASGYLARRVRDGRYELGPALAVAGRVALKGLPLLDLARRGADELFETLGSPLLLATMIGDDMLAIHARADATGATVGMRTGERRPAVRLACLVFVAWLPAGRIDDWLGAQPAGGSGDAMDVTTARAALSVIRERGYQVTIFETEDLPLGELVADMARGDTAPDYRNRSLGMIASLERRMVQLLEIDPARRYEVASITAPIFDEHDGAPLGLTLGGFAMAMTGAEILAVAETLLRACLRIMRQQRGS